MSEIVRHATDSVICADASGKTVWVNQQFMKMSGYAFEEIVGKKPGSLLQGPGTDPATAARMREAIENQTEITTEILNYHKDGSPYWIKITITPIFDDKEVLTNFLSVERDITK